jgi:hypothetical protein
MAKHMRATMSLHNSHGVMEGCIWCEDSAKKESRHPRQKPYAARDCARHDRVTVGGSMYGDAQMRRVPVFYMLVARQALRRQTEGSAQNVAVRFVFLPVSRHCSVTTYHALWLSCLFCVFAPYFSRHGRSFVRPRRAARTFTNVSTALSDTR